MFGSAYSGDGADNEGGFSAKDVKTHWPYKGIPYVDGQDKEEEKAEKIKST